MPLYAEPETMCKARPRRRPATNPNRHFQQIFRLRTAYRMVIRAARKSAQGEYDTVNMSASQAKDLQPDTKSWWHDREQFMFWSALFATALFVFVAVSTAGDGYDHPPLITFGAPFAAIIGFSTIVIFGGRLIRKVSLLKIGGAVVCMAFLPLVIMQLLKSSRTPPNVHNGEAVVFALYVGLSEVTAAVFLVAALICSVSRRN